MYKQNTNKHCTQNIFHYKKIIDVSNISFTTNNKSLHVQYTHHVQYIQKIMNTVYNISFTISNKSLGVQYIQTKNN